MNAADIALYLNKLLDEYHFNVQTLAKYLSVNVESVYQLARGNMQALPDKPLDKAKFFDKVLFLAIIPEELPDQKAKAFLKILLTYHQLSEETIAKMAGIKIADVSLFLSDQSEKLDAEIKYKIASVTMALRFFLKDNEPE